jgi:hypothetical protein
MPDKPSRQNGWSRRKKWFLAFLALMALGLTTLAMLVLIVSSNPQTGAQGADWLRSILGNKPVAELEAVVFTIQDKLHQLAFKVEKSTPSAPWDVPALAGSTLTSAPATIAPVSTSTPVLDVGGLGISETPTQASPSPQGSPTSQNDLTNAVATSSPAPAAQPWKPANLVPLGNIPDEGVWTPYIQDASGATVAYRTFLQPDPERPYVTVGVVAFDLSRVQLKYALGLNEPVSTVKVLRSGRIPISDQVPGVLLAAFNGAFKTVHGDYGAYAENTVLVPPTDGLGTIAIYNDGSVRIGEWGKDLSFSPDMVAYRQNCPLMVQDGEINPLVNNNSVNDWGGTISGNIVTFRSGVGLSQDWNTLYYFAGNTLTMPSLAKAMQDAGAYQAMQLDINNYYVHFVSFLVQDGKLSGLPLLPKEMYENVDRYLNGFGHDFFYVTGK